MRRLPETALRQEMLRFGRMCHERELLVAMDGNLSARLSDELLLCTRAGCHKGLLVDEDLVVVDLSGKKRRGRGEPTSEMAMHLACYRARPDVQAVVHAHPPTCVAFTVAGVSLAQCVLPEAVLTIGSIPTLEYERTGSHELAEVVGGAARSHDAVMMDRHGAVCMGSSLLDAFCKLETMEQTAKVLLAARQLGQVRELPQAEAEALRTMGVARYGGPPSVQVLPEHCQDCSGCGNPSQSGLGRRAGFSVARLARPVSA